MLHDDELTYSGDGIGRGYARDDPGNVSRDYIWGYCIMGLQSLGIPTEMFVIA